MVSTSSRLSPGIMRQTQRSAPARKKYWFAPGLREGVPSKIYAACASTNRHLEGRLPMPARMLPNLINASGGPDIRELWLFPVLPRRKRTILAPPPPSLNLSVCKANICGLPSIQRGLHAPSHPVAHYRTMIDFAAKSWYALNLSVFELSLNSVPHTDERPSAFVLSSLGRARQSGVGNHSSSITSGDREGPCHKGARLPFAILAVA